MSYNIKTHNRDAFAAFVENKSVAIVGRAEYLNTIQQGKFIDSHDIVIRAQSNLPYPSPKFQLAILTTMILSCPQATIPSSAKRQPHLRPPI